MQRLDAIDCVPGNIRWDCLGNLVDEFGTMDFSDPDQCTYVDEGCGGLPEPYFRHWDCLDPDQLTPAEATFLASTNSSASLKMTRRRVTTTTKRALMMTKPIQRGHRRRREGENG